MHAVLSCFSCVWLFASLMDCSLPGSSVHGDSPGKNTGVGCHALLQGIFPTQELNLCFLCLLHCRRILCPLSHRESLLMVYITKKCWVITTIEDHSQCLKRKEPPEAHVLQWGAGLMALRTQMHWEPSRESEDLLLLCPQQVVMTLTKTCL